MNIIMNRLEKCKSYKPKFGTGSAVSLDEFKAMHGEDPLYGWFGLDNPMLYAAHKAAGGITSVYRQVGLSCEEVFRKVLRDELGLSEEEVNWSYQVTTSGGRERTLSLDGRLDYAHIPKEEDRAKVANWVNTYASKLDVAPKIKSALDGAVFEVRQGYKSKDSKRQNADISNITSAYSKGYLPVFTLLSTQVDSDIITRYKSNNCAVLIGTLGASPYLSTYAFCREVVGYDLASFFERNKDNLRETVTEILESMLAPTDDDE
jgi:hypothetical protein